MENYFQFKGLEENDVIEFEKCAYRIKKLLDTFSKKFSDRLGNLIYNYCINHDVDIYPPGNNFSSYFNEGLDCHRLKIGDSKWQKGKFKINISVEFIPEFLEPENQSELDAVRETINNQN